MSFIFFLATYISLSDIWGGLIGVIIPSKLVWTMDDLLVRYWYISFWCMSNIECFFLIFSYWDLMLIPMSGCTSKRSLLKVYFFFGEDTTTTSVWLILSLRPLASTAGPPDLPLKRWGLSSSKTSYCSLLIGLISLCIKGEVKSHSREESKVGYFLVTLFKVSFGDGDSSVLSKLRILDNLRGRWVTSYHLWCSTAFDWFYSSIRVYYIELSIKVDLERS